VSVAGLFGRTVAVEIGPEGGQGVRLGDLRVGFRVEYKAAKTAPTATIRIWNPAPASQGLLRVPMATIRLLVGYGGIPKLVFAGPPVKGGISLDVDGGDRVLEVNAADGGRGYVQFLQGSYATATTFGQVLAEVLAQTQWARGTITVPEGLSLPHGIALTGRAPEVLDRLAAAVQPPGADWFVRDNALYVVTRGTSTPETAPLLSSTQGNLIGSPSFSGTGELKCRALIDATMRPGRAFVIESVGVNGTYVTKDVTFTGDSGWEKDFYMDLSAKPLGLP
jgi:hypothetical protein